MIIIIIIIIILFYFLVCLLFSFPNNISLPAKIRCRDDIA